MLASSQCAAGAAVALALLLHVHASMAQISTGVNAPSGVRLKELVPAANFLLSETSSRCNRAKSRNRGYFVSQGPGCV